MRISFPETLRGFACIFSLLAMPVQSLAQDNTNAAKIDLSLWGDMYQVMDGNSAQTPFSVPGPILTPKGIYAYVLVDDVVTAAKQSGIDPDTALKHYFSFLLNQRYVSGILFAAPWSLLNPNDPAVDPTTAYDWSPSAPVHSLDDAFDAIDSWNSNPNNNGSPAKTLQLNVTAGFNSPQWLYQPLVQTTLGPPSGYLSSCDGLFVTPSISTSPSCGYTTIFAQTEVPEDQRGHAPLPLPWNSTYQTKWKNFLIALNNHIQSKPSYISDFVSIAVAGPTATSSEIILPNEHDPKEVAFEPLQVSALPPGHSVTGGITVLSAWTCLLANNYGSLSGGLPYLDSDRAFIEAWATAIDTFGEVFSAVTLTLATGNGLPDFQVGSENPLAACPGLHNPGITFPNSSTPGYAKLSLAHPAFIPDCGTNPGTTPKFPMDCAAEVAILAYFAQPSVGGGNAKATQENALAASDDVVATLLSLSNASVKWLSARTNDLVLVGPQPDPTAPLSTYPEGSIGVPPVSRMMGGLQFALPAAVLPTKPTAGNAQPIPGNQKVGCTHPHLSSCGELTPVQALYAALMVFFDGTSKAAVFDAPTTIMNNGSAVQNAPINYLQIWADDVQYAAGYGDCSIKDIMTGSSECVPVAQKDMPWVEIGTTKYTAEGLLVLASKNIPTAPVTTATLYWYNKCKNQNQVPYCQKGKYYHRGAFENDLPCVSHTEQHTAIKETNYGLSTGQKLNHYSTNATDYSVHPYYFRPVPYGLCESGYVWRQAFMGDYVCVTVSEAGQILSENAGIVSGTGITCP